MSVPDHAITPADNAWMRSLGGRFVVFDGPDGSGKSTQFRRFADMVRVSGIEVVEVREPGGTAIGEKIRAILLDPANAEMTTRTEMLLYMASRAQLFEQRIAPSLAAGALGSRMVGGGFGGSAIALVKQEDIEKVKSSVMSAFEAKRFKKPRFFISLPSAGASASRY